jgi:transcriptional regulator with XRE-family HTH domain
MSGVVGDFRYGESMNDDSRFAYETAEGTSAALRAARAHMRLSQDELAQQLEVNGATVGRREAGAVPDNAWERAYLLEQVAELGCPRGVLGLPPTSSLVISTDLPVDPDLLRAYLRAEEEALDRSQRRRRQSSDGEG